MTSIWSSAAEHFEERPDYAANPLRWVAERLPDVQLWSKQREILNSVRDNANTAVKAAHSVGKSYVAGLVVCWFIDAHPPGESIVVTSAPTAMQVRAILWKEINRQHRAGGLPGRTNMTEWYSPLGELQAFGRKPSDYDPSAFQGHHARHVLVVLDEAGGIRSEALWDAAASLASGEHGRMLAVGNPDDPSSHFATVCSRPTWNTIQVSAFDSPNFSGETVSDRVSEVLVSKRWVEEKRLEWTETSPVYVAKVLGEFPTDATDGVVPMSWVTPCRYLELDAQGDVELGLDVSAGGADRTVLWARQGSKALQKWVKVGEKDPLALADWVLEVIQETGATSLKVDSIGVGWGVGGTIDGWHRDGLHDCVVVPVNVSTSPDDEEHFLNLRAEIWWQARERSRMLEWDLGVLDDDDIAELTCVRYHHRNPRARVQVERKEELKKRTGSSPDSADALLLSFHIEVFEAVSYVDQMTAARLPSL